MSETQWSSNRLLNGKKRVRFLPDTPSSRHLKVLVLRAGHVVQEYLDIVQGLA